MTAGALLTSLWVGNKFIEKHQYKTECVKFNDKHLDKVLSQIDEGIKEIQQRNPNLMRPNISSGLRGTRYFIEFPITGKNIDAFSILAST
jgi:hypothetical protein